MFDYLGLGFDLIGSYSGFHELHLVRFGFHGLGFDVRPKMVTMSFVCILNQVSYLCRMQVSTCKT